MATTKNKTAEGYFALYKANKRWESNRKRRLERVLKEQPTNEQVKQAMKGMVYRRKTPGAAGWSASGIRAAKLYKEFTGIFDKNLLSADPKLQHAAAQRKDPNRQYPKIVPTTTFSSFFSLGARLQGNR